MRSSTLQTNRMLTRHARDRKRLAFARIVPSYRITASGWAFAGEEQSAIVAGEQKIGPDARYAGAAAEAKIPRSILESVDQAQENH
jgi:hypothetical protein